MTSEELEHLLAQQPIALLHRLYGLAASGEAPAHHHVNQRLVGDAVAADSSQNPG